MSDKLKLGIFGGTFDPIHHGHLIAAQTSLEALHLDRVLFLPSAHPPHKELPMVSPYSLRRQMVQLAIQDNPRFVLSDLEALRPDPSYTIQTLKDLRREYPPDNYHLLLLLGADNLADFTTWKQPEKILEEISIAVMARPGFDISDAPSLLRDNVQWIQIPLIDISSTDIRDRVAQNLPIQYLVPQLVDEFIQQYELYKSNLLKNIH
jgi:nicotinate-nucleotide adenylyltransferase